MTYIAPTFRTGAFNCPTCNAYAHMNWSPLIRANGNLETFFQEATCANCTETSIWKVTDYEYIHGHRSDKKAELIYPDNSNAELPEKDMPEDVKKDYEEAAIIVSRSPRAAAALLRLGLQKLCVHLGEEGKHIDTDIRSLAGKKILSPQIIKVADTIRLTGNNAVHPGEMNEEDVDFVAGKMFALINFIIKKGISEPKELKALYELTPERAREAAETKDNKAREKLV